jgi:ankyrin repeat protein
MILITSNGWSPLDRSVWAGQREVTELLLAYGADVNITDSINRLK